ncbi:MAG TPA: hypothetical protein P5556_01860 [Candidatus Gastranaerophilales bacterium]|nr:hypothetical protein [Candidatus Gastranaerophilales bacterium]
MEKRKFISVHFSCCNVYNRIYINKEGTAYVGRCPGCMRSIKFKIGQGGLNSRFFESF